MAQNQVTVKGIVDPQGICERLRKRTMRNATVISPPPPPPPTDADAAATVKEEPVVVHSQVSEVTTMELHVNMHCEACAQQLQKKILKMRGVQSVDANSGAGKLTVTGAMSADKLVQYIHRRTGKLASVVPPPPPPEPPKEEEPKKEEPAKEEAKEEAAPAKGEEPKAETAAAEVPAKEEAKPAAEEPKAEAAAEEVKAEAPAPEEPKAEAAPAEEPKAEEPAKEEPKAEAASEEAKPSEPEEKTVVVAEEEGTKTVEAIEETVVPAAPEPAAEAEAAPAPAAEPKEELIWGVPLVGDDERTDTVLLKFLRAREFKVKEAMAMLKSAVLWRKRFGIDELLGADLGLPELENVVFYRGADREGHPVCYNVYGEFQDKELYEKAFGDEEKRERFLKWRIQLLERGIREQLDFSPSGICSMVQVTDLKNSPPMLGKHRAVTRQALALLQDNYPEFVAKKVQYNLSSFASIESRILV